MGKPIAGQNQFPYTVGGFLVDGAKINGVTYAKKLYIHKQRSYSMYDLMDTDGNIFRFIRIGYQDNLGNMLNYFDTAENLVETIPNNTFFLKIQDASRNIFSFVRIYQWHKCITVEGDYVFRTANIDPVLSGVLINPSVSTIQVGKTLSYQSLFFPSSYSDKDGTWFMNSLDGPRTSNSASIVSTELNTAVIKGEVIGKAVLVFVPSRNDSLVTHSIINVVDNDLELEFFKVLNTEGYDAFKLGEEYTVEVVTYPYEYTLTSALDIEIDDSNSYKPTLTELVSVSDDFKKYTFKTTTTVPEDDEEYPHVSANPEIKFKMTDPFEYDYTFYDISVVGDMWYEANYESPGAEYFIPLKLRPNMTYQCKKYQNGPNTEMYPYVSSDPSMATMDYETGILTTFDKKGTVNFSTQYKSVNGVVTDYDLYNSLIIMDEVYDTILMEPQKITSMYPGEVTNFTITGYREGYDPVDIPLRTSLYPKIYTVSEDGTVTVAADAPTDSQVYVWPTQDINIDTQLLDIYKSVSVRTRVKPEGTIVPMTDMYSTTDTDNKTFWMKLVDEGFEDLYNIIVYPTPYLTNMYEMTIDSYDETIVEVYNKDYLLDTFQYTMGSLYMFLKPLKRGSTEMVISSVNYPDVKITIKLIVY